jgi:hypothetical protein
MKAYNNENKKLENAIAHLENEKKIIYDDLILQAGITYKSMKPINILKQSIDELRESPEIKTSLLQTVLSVSGGYLSKKILVGKSNSILKNLMGYAVQYGVTHFISKKVESNL